jgi:cobalt-zinc-cadmium efflux system outer membrane protein
MTNTTRGGRWQAWVLAGLLAALGCTTQREDRVASLPLEAVAATTPAKSGSTGEPTSSAVAVARAAPEPPSDATTAPAPVSRVPTQPTPQPGPDASVAAEPAIVRTAYQDDQKAAQPAAQPDEQLPPPKRLPDAEPKLDQSPAGLTLDQIINTVLLADPTIRAGFELINQATGEALQAALLPNPKLLVNQSLLPLTRPFTKEKQGGPPQLDVIVTYPIDWFLFGKRAAAMLAAGLGVHVSESEFADLIRQRVRDAALAYYDVLEAKAKLELAELDAANFRQVESITKKAVDGGNRPLVELNRVRLDRLKAEQTVRDAQNKLVAAKASLRALMGLADADPAFDVSGTLEMIQTPEILDAERAYELAVQNRPDLAALRWKLAQAEAEVVSQYRQAYPEVTPQLGYTRQFQSSIGQPNANSFGFGVEMSLPVFNRNQGNRYRAQAVAVQQQYELRRGLVDLRAEITQLEKDLRTAAANAKAVAEEQLRLAVEVRDSINSAYAVGGRPLIDALDAQRNYRETYRIYIESRTNLGRAAARFNAAIGKKVTP